MPYGNDPPAEAFVLHSVDLILKPISVDDAQEAFDLMWHPEITYLETTERPGSLDALREGIRVLCDGGLNGSEYRRYQWVARRTDTGALVALATAVLETYTSLRLERDESGKPGDMIQEEVRVAEATVYVHPDHQEEKGNYWGSKSASLVWRFSGDYFDCALRRGKIRLDNWKSQRRAESWGMEKVRSGDPPGYGIWEGPNR